MNGTRDPEKIAEKIFLFLESDLPMWSKTGVFPAQISTDRFNKGFSNPAFGKVKIYLSRFGYDEYKRDLNRMLGMKTQVIVNMLNHLVDTRNNIAHGDPSATKTPREIFEMMEMILTYCRATDDVFASWCKAKFCSIR